MSGYWESVLWLFGIPVLGVALGVAGLVVRALRPVLAPIGPLWCCGFFVYGLFRGGPNDCNDLNVCQPTSFFSYIGTYGVIVVTLTTLLSLGPLAAWWWRWRAPSIVGAVGLAILVVAFPLGLFVFVPGASAVVAAAIAGPPGRPSRGVVAHSAAR